MSREVLAPLQLPTLRVELTGIKQYMVTAISASSKELADAITQQLTECLQTLTPEEIMVGVRRAFDEALHEAVREQAPELVREAVEAYFTTGDGAFIVRDAIRQRFNL